MSEFIRVARLSEIPPGSMKRVDLAGHAVTLANIDGHVYAFDDTCTHEESSLSEGTLFGDVVTCAKHGARFNVKTGRVLSLPAVRSLAVYPVRVEGDDVLVSPEAQKTAGLPHRR